jgi:hypothetical protein
MPQIFHSTANSPRFPVPPYLDPSKVALETASDPGGHSFFMLEREVEERLITTYPPLFFSCCLPFNSFPSLDLWAFVSLSLKPRLVFSLTISCCAFPQNKKFPSTPPRTWQLNSPPMALPPQMAMPSLTSPSRRAWPVC